MNEQEPFDASKMFLTHESEGHFCPTCGATRPEFGAYMFAGRIENYCVDPFHTGDWSPEMKVSAVCEYFIHHRCQGYAEGVNAGDPPSACECPCHQKREGRDGVKQTIACATSNHAECSGTTATGDPPVDAANPPEPCACFCHSVRGETA